MDRSHLSAPEKLEEDPALALARLLAKRRVVALAGAGMSTESGIPDYRGPETARRARNAGLTMGLRSDKPSYAPSPIQARRFLHEPAARARYWARSMNGWPRFAAARPNAAHHALAALEQRGILAGIITQNVDGLHQAAGSARVVELHGALARVVCLECRASEPRAAVQERLVAENPSFALPNAELAPDGDAELDAGSFADFHVPACLACGGVLKPDVVFFGENVPAPVVSRAFSLFDEAEVLLVVGSSLTVFSGYRFVRRASERGVPVAIVNLGPTRGDDHALFRVDARLGEVLPRLAAALDGGA